MRSLIFALALAAPVGAVFASPNPAPSYSDPMTTAHHQQEEQLVFITFVNKTPQDREVRIGNVQYKVRYNSEVHVYARVGSVVREFSDQNRKVNGQELMQVSANDVDKDVFLK
jgi:hypothetical protein